MRNQTSAARVLGEQWFTHAEFQREMFDPAAFESDAVAIHVVSAEGLIVEVNRAFEIMYGASRRLYLGKHNAILGADPLSAGVRLLEGIRRAVKPGGVWRGTIRYERFNGATSQARTHVYPMRCGGRTYLVFFQEEVQTAAKSNARIAIRAREPVLAATT